MTPADKDMVQLLLNLIRTSGILWMTTDKGWSRIESWATEVLQRRDDIPESPDER